MSDKDNQPASTLPDGYLKMQRLKAVDNPADRTRGSSKSSYTDPKADTSTARQKSSRPAASSKPAPILSSRGTSYINAPPVDPDDPLSPGYGQRAEGQMLENVLLLLPAAELGKVALSGARLGFDALSALRGVARADAKKIGEEVVAEAAKINEKYYRQLEQLYQEKGAKPILKALKSTRKTLEEHLAKIEQYEKSGGFTSAVKKQIMNQSRNLQTLKKFIVDKLL